MDYYLPELKKVAVSLEADEKYYPIHESRDSTIVKSSIDAVIASHGTIDIDCGINIKISAGYKINAKAIDNGVLAVSSKIEKSRLIITLVNLGKQSIELRSGDPFARISLAPVYEFEWYNKKDYR